MKRAVSWVALALMGSLVSTSCRSGPEPVSREGSPGGDFRPTGEVTFSGFIPLVPSDPGSASFGPDRVVGPLIDVSRRADGSWAGRIQGQPVEVASGTLRITGSGININIVPKAERLELGGLWQGETVRVVLDAKEIRVTSPWRSFTLPAIGPGLYGDTGQLRLSSEAGTILDGPHPQLELALLATLSAGSGQGPTSPPSP